MTILPDIKALDQEYDTMRQELWDESGLAKRPDIWKLACNGNACPSTELSIRDRWATISEEATIRDALNAVLNRNPHMPESMRIIYQRKNKRTLQFWHVAEEGEPENLIRTAIEKFFERQLDAYLLKEAVRIYDEQGSGNSINVSLKVKSLNAQATRIFIEELRVLDRDIPEYKFNGDYEIELEELVAGAIRNVIKSTHDQIHPMLQQEGDRRPQRIIDNATSGNMFKGPSR